MLPKEIDGLDNQIHELKENIPPVIDASSRLRLKYLKETYSFDEITRYLHEKRKEQNDSALLEGIKTGINLIKTTFQAEEQVKSFKRPFVTALFGIFSKSVTGNREACLETIKECIGDLQDRHLGMLEHIKLALGPH